MSVRAVILRVSCLLVLGAAGLEGRVPTDRDPSASVIAQRTNASTSASSGAGVTLSVPSGPSVARQSDTAGSAEAGRPATGWWGWRLLGRLHPMVVHFPIGLLTAAAIIEALHVLRGRPVPSEPGTYCLVIGVIGGLVSVAFGTLNAAHQSVTGDAALALERHRMMGWTAMVAAVAALGAGRLARRRAQLRTTVVYVGLVLATSAVVGATGHLGGGLVYGEDYLTGVLPWNQDAPRAAVTAAATTPAVPVPAPTGHEAPASVTPPPHATGAEKPRPVTSTPSSPAPAPSHSTAPAVAAAASDLAMQAAAGVDFTRDVMPIFEKTCVECHGPDKVKARLRMDSIAALQKGGKSGALFKAGDPENSLVMRRVLGLDGEDQMPLDKDPLTEAQIDTLKRWIAGGASFGAGGSQ